MALHDTVIRGGKTYPERAALLFQDRTWSYGEMDAITDRIAANLLAQGLQSGDRVALLFLNCPEMVCSYYACFKAGLIAVPLSTRMKAPELAYVLNHSGARLLLGQADLFREIEPIRATIPALETCFLTEDGGDLSDYNMFAALQEANLARTEMPLVHADAIAVILYTSGTTARPKGVMHTHRSLEQLVEAALAVLGRDTMAVSAAVPPLSHMGSLGGVLLPTFRTGGMILLFPRFEPALLLHAIEAHHVTYFWLLPVMYAALTQVPNACSRNLASIKVCLTAGDAMPDPIRTRFRETFGRDALDICGMTEIIYSLNPPNTRARPGSIGLPLPGISMRLVDSFGADVSRGEVGEILAQGSGIMAGYWQDPNATAATVQDGWLYTGDLAREDEEGYYWFVGRKKDVIIRGGSNIAPAEVEEALHTHPEVAAAGVIGVSDPLWGQAVWAFVTLKENATANAETLQAHLRERIAAYKVPETIRLVPALPIGLTGKIHRQTLREWAAEMQA